MSSFYEVVSYERASFLIGTGMETYCVPHIHREFEFGIVFRGEMHLIAENDESCVIRPGDFYLVNPWLRHECKASSPTDQYGFLEIQLPFSLFQQWYPSANQLRFHSMKLTRELLGDAVCKQAYSLLLDIAENYYEGKDHFELHCAGSIFYLMEILLQNVPHTLLTEADIQAERLKCQRMHRISEYINEHANEKLELRDIAREEGVTLNYLSHYFKECWGIPFLTYLQHMRCIRAAELLRTTHRSATDIALSCGFSALKYMNQGFREIFGMTPDEYRKHSSSDGTLPTATVGADAVFPSADPRAVPGSGSPFAPTMSAQEALAVIRSLKKQ